MNSVWYDGTLFLTNGNGVAWERNTIGLKKGNENLSLGMWSNQARKKFISRSTYLVEHSTNDPIVFIPTYRKGMIPSPSESKSQINNLNRWLKRNGMLNYTYVAELGKKSKLLHYHYLVDMPKVNPREISNAWSRIRGDYSNNAIRGLEHLKDVQSLSAYYSKGSKAIAYAAKGSQLSKEGGTLPQGMRVWQTSHGLVGKEKISTNEFVPQLVNVIAGKNPQKRIIQKGLESFEIIQYKLSRSEVKLLENLIEEVRDKKEFENNRKRKSQKNISIELFDKETMPQMWSMS